MNQVKVEGRPVRVHSGQVQLTAAQAAPRKHALRAVGKTNKDGAGVYDVLAPLSFKVGETFGFSGAPTKAGELRDRDAETLAAMAAEDRIRAEERARNAQELERVRMETTRGEAPRADPARVEHAPRAA